MTYKSTNEEKGLIFTSKNGNIINIDKYKIIESIFQSHNIIDKFTEFEVDVFGILGMRNLSSFIGEIFASCLIKNCGGLFAKNPHQDGYPDLILLDELGKKIWEKLKDRLREKQPFSPFENGGIEIKATCGSVPTPAFFLKKGLSKPYIGDQRIDVLSSYDWKAHHRETNNLMSLLWDFIDGIPRIVAVFYSNELTVHDWSDIIKPKEGGGRTTSVSIMNRNGVKKMYNGTVFVINDEKYISFLNRYNQDNLL